MLTTRFHMAVRSKGTAFATAVVMLTLPAHAADLLTKAAPAPIAYSWTGAYVGANFGGAFNHEDMTTPIGLAPTDPSGVLGGGQLGYNYQFSTWLLGIEGEFDGTTAQGTANFVDPVTSTALAVTSDHRWYSTASGRLGYVMGSLMIFAKAGGAWMNADYQFSVTNSGLTATSSINSTRSGWNAGVGLEYLLSPKWSAKVEYDYLDFGSNTVGLVTPVGNGVTFKTNVNEVKVGLNYHFGGF
jgi:opacity protein-like surface antigen